MKVGIDVTAVPANPAGAGRYVLELVNQLRERKQVDVTVVARKNDAARWRPNVVAKAPGSRPARLVWEQVVLPREIKNLGFDVFHSPHYTMPETAKKPVVVTMHDMTLFDHPEWHERSKVLLFRRAIAVAVKRASGLIAVSSDTAMRLQQRFGALDVTVIPHGVDHSRFNTDGKTDKELLEGFGISSKYIAFVGTLEPRKDIPTLVAAFDAIAAKHGELNLVIAGGKGWGTDEVTAAISKSRNSGRIVLTGFVPDSVVPALLRQAEVVAYPSLAEGFGLPALEALACGAPLVTTTGSAMEEVVEDAALLVAPGDETGLSEAIARLLTDADEVKRLRKRGPEVAAKFTWAASAEAHEAVYKRVANS